MLRSLSGASPFAGLLLVCALSTTGQVTNATPDSTAQHARLDQILEQLREAHSFPAVSISPDGRWVAWVENTPSSGESAYLLDWKRPGAKPNQLTIGSGSRGIGGSGFAWSPDSSKLAFLSRGDSSQEQIFCLTVEAGPEAHQVGKLDGFVKNLQWSPDGKQIALLYAAHGGGAGPLEAVPAQTGVIGSEIHNQQLSLLSAGDGQVKQLTPPNLNIYEYDWSPQGDRFVAIAAPGPADNNWWTAKLYIVSAQTGQMTPIYDPPKDRQIAAPHWSPDGSRIALIGGLMSDEGFDGGDILVVPDSGGAARDVTEGLNATPDGLQWRDKDDLLFTEVVEGGGGIATLNIKTGEQETLWKGVETLHQDGNFPNLNFARDGVTSVAVRSSWEHPPEIAAGRIGEWKALTSSNAAQKPHWGKAESVVWQSEGHPVQGWLLYPYRFDPTKRYPMVVEIHGGPSGVRSASWPSAHFDMSVLAGLGYFVFFPNPRGSYGEGEAFTKANARDFGGGDLRDILAGVSAVLGRAPVDENRIGVTGWSYGGYMTMWTVTQTQRFRAAVAGAGIADWLSYYGENSIDQWMIPFFGASVYDDPAAYAKSSPISFIKQVKTPTLVVVGERDGECPAPQSFEFWHALKALNVPTELVVYPGEGHAFHEVKDQTDVVRRAADWFGKYLQ